MMKESSVMLLTNSAIKNSLGPNELVSHNWGRGLICEPKYHWGLQNRNVFDCYNRLVVITEFVITGFVVTEFVISKAKKNEIKFRKYKKNEKSKKKC